MSVRGITLLLFALPGLFAQGAAGPDSLAKAQGLFDHTDYRASLTLLRDSHENVEIVQFHSTSYAVVYLHDASSPNGYAVIEQ